MGEAVDRSNIYHEMKKLCEKSRCGKGKSISAQYETFICEDFLSYRAESGTSGRCTWTQQHRNDQNIRGGDDRYL